MSTNSTPPSELAPQDDSASAAPADPNATPPVAVTAEPHETAAAAEPVETAEQAPEDHAPEDHAPDDHASENAAQAPAAAPPSPRAPAVVPAEVAQKLKQLFPALFAGAPKPVKLRIQQDIQERAPGQFSKQDLSAFFRRHTRSTSYLHVLSRAKHRFDLDGQPAGEVSEEHRQGATEELNQRRASQDARREQEDQQRHLEEQQRRNRAGLLRDFETTTLTRPNFCALKGVAVEELDGLLEIARREAQERPPERYFDDRRPPGRPQGQPPGAGRPRPGGDRGRPPQGARRHGGGGGGAGGTGGTGGGNDEGGRPGPRDRGNRPPGDRGPAPGTNTRRRPGQG